MLIAEGFSAVDVDKLSHDTSWLWSGRVGYAKVEYSKSKLHVGYGSVGSNKVAEGRVYLSRIVYGKVVHSVKSDKAYYAA